MCKNKGYCEEENNEEQKDDLLDSICSELCRDSDTVDVVSTGDRYVILQEDRVGKKYKVISDYTDKGALTNANPKLKVYEDRGFKFGDYLEVLVDYETMLYYNPREFVMYEFYIDNVIVQIDNPSFLFDVVMNEFSHDKYYESNAYHTISFKGISENNYEEYLTKALFLIGYYNQSTTDSRYPTCFEFLGEFYYKYAADEDEIERRRNNYTSNFDALQFNDIKYYEALAFYNEGKRLHGHEASFQYFYKVIEYFFLICRQNEFKTFINDYNTYGNIEEFIEKVTNVYRQNEDSQLRVLMQAIEIEITLIIKECFDNGYIKENTVEAFSESLYLYRNTIVHGKSDERFAIKIPSNIDSQNETFWNMVTEKIAEKLIVKYCLN